MENTQTIILAAGKGTRMGGDIPKVLTELGNKPMLKYVLESVHSSGDLEPIIVVGYKSEMVKDACNNKYNFVLQKEQKGTGHAVLVAEGVIKSETKSVVVIYGDQPFVTPATINNLAEPIIDAGAKIVLATSVIENEDLFQKQFERFGRIIRNDKKEIIRIVEAKDATSEELKIREVNIGFLSLNKKWGFNKLRTLKNDNVKKEYYLTDLVKNAFSEGEIIHSVQINEKEALGANTPGQLKVLESYLD